MKCADKTSLTDLAQFDAQQADVKQEMPENTVTPLNAMPLGCTPLGAAAALDCTSQLSGAPILIRTPLTFDAPATPAEPSAEDSGNLVMNLPVEDEEKPADQEHAQMLMKEELSDSHTADGKTSPTQTKKATPKSTKTLKAGETAPAMHAIRMSANGFRQRWNGQQWRRLCDDPTCPREAQRLSRCAKHQPVKEWRPARRSRSSSSKSHKGSSSSSKMGLHHADFHQPMPLLANGMHPMSLSDPMLFPGDSSGLTVVPTSAAESHEDGTPSPVQWWPPAVPGAMPSYAMPYSNPGYSHAPAAAYSYENLAMMYGSMPSSLEPLVPAWPVPQPTFNHMQ